jgi:hypothetical protein
MNEKKIEEEPERKNGQKRKIEVSEHKIKTLTRIATQELESQALFI